MTRNIDHNRLGQLRQGQGEIANHIIDEFAAGRLSRRDFIRRGTVVGISVPLLGSILAACGSSAPSSSRPARPRRPRAQPGAVIKAGIVTPTGAINPVTVADQGGLDMLAQTGEYLCLSSQTLTLKPVLATSWTPNGNADVWTFKIRQGVKFHNGHALTADDVVYTYQLHTNPKGGANALSAFGGVLIPSGVKKVDDFTVAFHLSAPNGNFPYLTSSDNYNMIILPKGYDPAKWESTFIGTGPFKLGSYTPKSGATFTRNESYWGTKALPSQTMFTFYDTQNPSVLALTGGNIDVVGQFSVSGGEELLTGSYNIIKLKSSAHRELSMRCDKAPFTDAAGPAGDRAHAQPAADRPGAVQGLRRRRQRQPVRAGVPVHRHQRGAADAEHRQGQVAARRGRAQLGVQHPAGHRAVPRDPRVRPDRGAGGQGHRGEDQPEGGELSPRTTARPRSGTPTGWTPP